MLRWLPGLACCTLLIGLPASARAEEPVPRHPQFQVNQGTTGNQLLPRIAAVSEEGFLVVWHSGTSPGDDDSGTSILGRRLGGAGDPLGDEFQINATTTGDQRGAAVAFDSLGRGLLVWESESSGDGDNDGWSIQGLRFDSLTGPVGTDFQVNAGTTGDQRQPEVAALATGGFVVAWKGDSSAEGDTSGSSVQARRFDPAGQSLGDDFQVNSYTTGDQSRPALAALPTGGFVVAWESYGSAGADTSSWSLFARRFSADGAPTAEPFAINEFTTSQQRDPAVAVSPDGQMLVTWQSSTGGESDLDWGIHGRVFADDFPLGGQFQVNTTTSSDQYYSAVLHDGRDFLVVWKSFGSALDDPDLSTQARRFATDGSALGGELQVNDHVTGDQKLPRLAQATAGPIVVVWESETSALSDSSGWSVQGRLLDVPIFRDGFESGDTSLWTLESPAPGFP